MANSINYRWHDTLKFLAGMLDEDKTAELVNFISESYFATKSQFDSREYNPYLEDLCLATECMGENRGTLNSSAGERVFIELVSIKPLEEVHYRLRYEQIIEALRTIGNLRVIRSLKSDILSGHLYAPSTIRTLAKLSIKDILEIGRPEVFKLYSDDTCHFVWAGEINRYRNPAGIDTLIDFLNSNHLENYQVIKALGEIGLAKAIEPLQRYLKNGLNTPFRRNFAQDAEEALAKIHGEKVATKNKPTEIKRLSDKPLSVLLTFLEPNHPESYYALQRIGDLGGKAAEAVPMLIGRLETAGRDKQEYILALGRIGDERAIPYLIKFLKSKEKDNHYGAIALGEFLKSTGEKKHEALAELRALIESDEIDNFSKSYVVGALLNYDDCADVLTEAITKNPELAEWLGSYIETPLRILNEKQRKKVLPVLEEHMLKWSFSSYNLAKQIGQLGNKRSTQALLKYLSKGLNELFHLANTYSIGSGIFSSIDALANIGDMAAVPQLNQFLLEKDQVMAYDLKNKLYECIQAIHKKNKPTTY